MIEGKEYYSGDNRMTKGKEYYFREPKDDGRRQKILFEATEGR